MMRVDLKGGPYDGIRLETVNAGGLLHGVLVGKGGSHLLLAQLDLRCEVPVYYVRPECPCSEFEIYNLHGSHICTGPTEPLEVS